MKKIKDLVKLSGEVTINVMELRAHIGDILTQVSLGKTVSILRKGELVGHIVPPGCGDFTIEIGPDGKPPCWFNDL